MMPVSVLSTKFYIPPARENAVERTHLTSRLFSGVNRPGCFSLISSPAGFGKTTILSEFISHLQLPVAWVSLDEGDNDPIHFWTCLITSFQSILGNIGESALELFNTQQSLPDNTAPTILINDLAAHNQSMVLVLDDYHIIQSQPVHSGMQFLLDHLPNNLHIIVSTRHDPPWPMARFRASNQLTEIRAQDLRFSIEEATEFLNHTMGLNLSHEDIAALEDRTEGWAAGLQLAALSIKGRSDAPAFIQAFTGSNLYVAEYLVEEVIQRQSEAMREFLLQTSILKRMNAGLCEAVTDCQDGQAILQSLRHTNTFLVSLDSEGHWFRYHHLFAELLKSRLTHSYPEGQIASLHLRAATWFEHHQLLDEAIHHAFASKNYEKAASLIDQYGQGIFYSERYSILRNWLDALSPEIFTAHPRLEIYRLLFDLNKGTLDMYEQTLIEKEKLIKDLPKSPENDRLRRTALVSLSLSYAFQNTTKAIQIAEEALAEIPEANLQLLSYVYSTFYRAFGMEGNIEKSAPAYRECFRLSEISEQYEMLSNTTMIRAFDLCQYGRLDEAAEYCQRIIDAGARRKSKVFYPAGSCYIGLAGIHLERNDLQKAEEYLTLGLDLCQQGDINGLFTGYVQKIRLLQANDEIEESLKELQLLEQTFQRREFTLMAQKVSLLLAAGDLATASGLVSPMLAILGASHYAQRLPLIAMEAFKLSLARIYIALEEIDKANQLLDEIQTTVEPGLRFGRLMEVHLLRALALQKQNSGTIPADAIANLARAIDLAVAPGFVTLFLEEGSALIPLLKAIDTHQTFPGRIKTYARKLLNAFNGIGKPLPLRPASDAIGLIEQLTPREMEVLECLASGDSNQTIAEKLVITVRTVKKHASNIYGKLSASSRTQAIARAHELGLLSTD
ncbi:MAG: hypothetical protein JW908_13345 [Anaerolineales bacterium]|nr:hypothetical protein [Anaerolineales bacterium]